MLLFIWGDPLAILNNAQIREHIETDLSDDALDRLLAAAEALITDVTGVIASQTDTLRTLGETNLYLTRAAASITTVKERDFPTDDQTTIAVDDFRLVSGYLVKRLRDGTNPRIHWAAEVEVIYVPDIDAGMVEGVQIELVRLAVVNAGAQRERHGDFDFWHQDRLAATKSALGPLTSSRVRMPLR